MTQPKIGEASAESPDVPNVEESEAGGGVVEKLPLTRPQAMILALVVLLVVAYLAHRHLSDGESRTVEVSDDRGESEDDDGPLVKVEHDPSDPLAGDEALTKAFVDNGLLTAHE